jgi:biopolymer transport protein ExbB/TolQ
MLQTFNSGISQALYEVSSALLLPVMLAVLALFLLVLLMLGGLMREALDRRQVRAALRQALELLSHEPQLLAAWHALAQAPSGVLRRLTRSSPHLPDNATLAYLLADVETEVTLRLGRLAFLARVGPMLGLLGTLIPFGPALAGLSSGDVQELSANLVTAFATTVVGLLCGSLAFGISLVRRGWYARDCDELEHIARLLSERLGNGTAQDQEMGRDGRGSDGRIGQLV